MFGFVSRKEFDKLKSEFFNCFTDLVCKIAVLDNQIKIICKHELGFNIDKTFITEMVYTKICKCCDKRIRILKEEYEQLKQEQKLEQFKQMGEELGYEVSE